VLYPEPDISSKHVFLASICRGAPCFPEPPARRAGGCSSTRPPRGDHKLTPGRALHLSLRVPFALEFIWEPQDTADVHHYLRHLLSVP